MTSSGTDSQVPAAPIASPSSGDSSTALFAQLNINGNNVVSLTSALSVVVQNTVIVTIQEVAAAAPVVTIAAPTASPVIDSTVTVASTATNSTPPVTTTPPAIVAATVTHTQAHCGVIYITPEPNSAGPFYWISRGRHIGVVATWQWTSTYVTGVSRSSYSRIRSAAEGIRLIEEAIDCGDTEVIP
ncbi:uncharacterized protein EDB91DRAFT_1249803 [Suillus paluster]|uniref:uncharacterized protein n=1 Tax=Suillus paluster TaxID=48578 RepID=UPI001B85CEA6|nr:uncharacterized protein EDB91DRAFT_1249803 [Suillus paluster]KAG1737157.1 hypothetical protein EDB91DRAFT_1249803 [Suillus paluster]